VTSWWRHHRVCRSSVKSVRGRRAIGSRRSTRQQWQRAKHTDSSRNLCKLVFLCFIYEYMDDGVYCSLKFTVYYGDDVLLYRSSTFNASWHEAREYCSAFGANLLALDSNLVLTHARRDGQAELNIYSFSHVLALDSLKEAHIIDYLLNSKPGRSPYV